ncbi:cilia- and flagella-associated protein 144 [Cebidichthys violaceus]|uniref:cilia- and flagella-associated protein 144 n=1 Tax=Cebidichthys violaceus TaxID=271503 RepID=UPI0035CA5BB3
MAGIEKTNAVLQDAINIERIRKERQHQKIQTEFTFNPHRKWHLLPDNPTSRKPTEVIAENSDIEAFQKAQLEPSKKYSMPQTASQEIGWHSTPLIPSNWNDKRLNFHRLSTEITKH